MSKSVEEMKRSLKRGVWLFVGFGMLFLGMLFLFIINTSRVEPAVVAVFGGMALVMFLMAFFLPRTTIAKLERDDGWQNVDKMNRMVKYVLIGHEIFFILRIILNVLVYWYGGSYFLPAGFIYNQIVLLSLLIILLVVHFRFRRILRLYLGFESKSFPDLSEKNIGLPAHLLEKHGIHFVSLGGKKEGRWVTFNEVLELSNGVIVRIRLPKAVSRKVGWIHPETGFKFTVEIGPETEENRDFIKEIKQIIDQLDEE